MSVTAYVALGANEGSRLASLRRAAAALDDHPQVALVSASSVWESPAAPPYDDQPDYLNAVVAVSTSLGADGLLSLLQALEADAGRTLRGARHPRILDLDLLLHGSEVHDRQELTVPHPRLRSRRFVLAPLLEVAPDAADPTDGVAYAACLEALPQSRCVRRSALKVWP